MFALNVFAVVMCLMYLTVVWFKWGKRMIHNLNDKRQETRNNGHVSRLNIWHDDSIPIFSSEHIEFIGFRWNQQRTRTHSCYLLMDNDKFDKIFKFPSAWRRHQLRISSQRSRLFSLIYIWKKLIRKVEALSSQASIVMGW